MTDVYIPQVGHIVPITLAWDHCQVDPKAEYYVYYKEKLYKPEGFSVRVKWGSWGGKSGLIYSNIRGGFCSERKDYEDFYLERVI